MKTTVEPLEGNKVKLSVEVDEAEFEKALDAAFRRIAREVRIPGFRPGKAPRRLLEARVGADVARQEALRESLPDFYARAVQTSELDAIAPPDIDITAGQESGAVAFDAVVQVRPRVSIPGYDALKVTVPSPTVSEDDVNAQIDRLRNQFGELVAVSRPARDGDHLSIDLTGTRHGQPVEGLTATDFLYELGSGSVLAELDEQLPGARPGDILKFNATPPGQEEEVTFQVLVKEVKEKVLPEVTDEWASEASEFETVEELRDDIRSRMGAVKRVQAQLALRDAVLDALVDLVDEEVPEAMVTAELERRIHDLSHRLETQGANLADYLEATGGTQEELLEGLRESSLRAVKGDLALRAVAEAEGIEVTEDDLETELARSAERSGQKPAALRRQLERAEQMPAVRSGIRKGKALEWLVDHVEVLDEEGRRIDRADLALPQATQPEATEGQSLPEERPEEGDTA